MNRTRKLGIAATLAGVITLGCGLAMTPRALAAPHGYDVGPRHAAFHDGRYARWDHRGYGRDYRWYGDRDGFRDHRYFDHHHDRHDFGHRRFRHYWR